LAVHAPFMLVAILLAVMKRFSVNINARVGLAAWVGPANPLESLSQVLVRVNLAKCDA